MEAFELRLWDSRIGRWLTVDPYGQYHSPYMGMGNNPISQVDTDGGMACPHPPCQQSVSTLVAEGYAPLSGDLGGLGGLGSNEPLLFGGAIQQLDQVVLTGFGGNSAGNERASVYNVLSNLVHILNGGEIWHYEHPELYAPGETPQLVGAHGVQGGARALSTLTRNNGRIFYVGEGAEEVARSLSNQKGYKTIYNTWFGRLGEKVTPFLNQQQSRRMWGQFSRFYANGAQAGDDIITVFGRHHKTGVHSLPVNSKSAWKTIEFQILQSKGIDYSPFLTR